METPANPPKSPPKNPVVVIPARMASTRLPGKPMADIGGAPMIARVVERAREAAIGPVVVACGEEEIADAVKKAGGEAVLTAPDLPSGSDRVFAALQTIDPDGAYDAIINLQGDLPLIDPAVIKAALIPLMQTNADIATLVSEISDPAEMDDPNTVKALVDFTANDTPTSMAAPAIAMAVNFSRAPMSSGQATLYHHIGIYAYRRAALERFVSLPPSPMEKAENLEQLRALENGMTIACALVDTVPFGVDTSADLERARSIFADRK